jgi:hypothetical protein
MGGAKIMPWKKIHPKDVKVGDYVTWKPEEGIEPVESCEVVRIEKEGELNKIFTISTAVVGSSWNWTQGIAMVFNDHFHIWRGPLPESEEE